jgi:hypothetical protein
MIIYVAFRKDYKRRKGELMGMLVDRRKDLRGKTLLESGLRWAKLAFGHLVKDKKDIFVLPKELKIIGDNDKRVLVEKGVFTKNEFSSVLRIMRQEVKSKRE